MTDPHTPDPSRHTLDGSGLSPDGTPYTPYGSRPTPYRTPHASAGATSEPRRFLIATAVARYAKCPSWDRPELATAREQIIDTFTHQLGYRHESALGMDVTRAQLVEHLRAFCRAPDRREDDLVAVYLSGHGEILDDGDEHVLYLADTDPADLTFTTLPTAQLARAMLRDTPLRRLLLVLDTCYSGRGGNELAAAALERISAQWRDANGSGVVVISSAQPHQQADAGLFPRLLKEAVGHRATAGHGPRNLSVSAVVQQVNDHRDRPGWQRVSLTLIGLTGEPPGFFANPRHDVRLNEVDLALQQAEEFDAQARRRDTELTRRLLVRAMGYGGTAEPRWWFSGRHTALADLAAWLNAPGGDACRIVTAGPGSGKTAVLGLVAALTHPERRATVPLHALGLSAAHLPDEKSVDVAVYAQKLSNSLVLEALAAAAGVRAGTVGEFLEALDERDEDRPFTALIDALDEAETPTTLCNRVLRPLIDHSRGRVRLLLGTRPYLLDRLGFRVKSPGPRREIVDLDHPRYADRAALTAYAARNLLDAHAESPYRERLDVVEPVARAVAQAAGNSFLVARIAASTLAADSRVVADPRSASWRAGLPRHAGDALREDLRRRLGADAGRATDLLLPLAYAEGQGLPWEDVWAPLATAVSGRVYTDEDLLWLRHHAGSYVVEAEEAGRSAYRLYHQALTDHLRDGTDPAAVHSAFTDVLVACVPYHADGTRDWSRAHPYALHHLAAHAAAAGRLDDLLADSAYLVHATPRGLTPHLHRAQSAAAQLTAAAYRSSLTVHEHADPTVRRQILALDATRAQQNGLRRQLIDRIPTGSWVPRWAVGSGFTPALRDTLTGHRGSVDAVACAVVDGRPVAVTGGSDRTVRVWDLMSGRPAGEPLTGHTDTISAVACTVVNGVPVAVTCGYDGTVRIWDLTAHRPVGEPLTGHDGLVLTVAAPVVDGTPVAVTGGRDGTVRMWDLAGRRPVGEPLTGYDTVLAVATTVVDGVSVVVTGGGKGPVRVWDLSTCRQLREPLGVGAAVVGQVACAELGGRAVAVLCGPETAPGVWDLASGQPMGELGPYSGNASATACAEVDGRQVVLLGRNDGGVRMWDLSSGQPLGEPLTGHTGTVNAIACAEMDDRPVAVTGGMDGTVRVWDLGAREHGDKAPGGHTGFVSTVACAELNGESVALTGGYDGTVRIWDPASGRPVGQPLASPDMVQAVACAEVDGRAVVLTGGYDGKVRMWDPASRRPVGGPLSGPTPSVDSLACAVVDGRPVAVSGGGRGTVLVWDLASRRVVGGPLAGHTETVYAVACAEVDGRPVAVTGAADATVRIWDLTTRRPLGEPLTGHTDFVVAVACRVVDGRPVAVTGGFDHTVRVWDLTSRQPVGEPMTGHTDAVLAVACAELDGRPVAVTSGYDGTLRVWDLRTRRSQTVARVSGTALDVDPAGRIVVAFEQDVAAFGRQR
ncbi:WD40 repeat domain-containing protein [Streptomyces sp. Go40/10]|uniref:caspase family protein n=1 Tax=Streptomyces sp. Go40/10 TaxID=2825844 RepID=UPI001E5314FF|nr:caspase family protein [Streptomyces sp. Go40/10]UFR05966.1 WD40 repeat domain-containing protein [Streptomyces sp. Go40/10]